ncbi:MAG: hypothetical protein WC804_10745 [Sphingomonas sp.]|jgi:hypothetical protein|uniref:hypothetical protein n=1 Tax=Sphingomonas sp. TaxID=28214 RepID=UPI0035653ED6
MITILAMLLQAAAPAPVAAPAPWAPITRGDTASGNLSVSAYVYSRTPGGRLAVRCDARVDKVVSIQFRGPGDLGAGPVRPVSLTIDGGTPLIANWEFISGIALEREDAAVTTIAAALAHAKEIKVHTTNLVGEPIDAVFDGPANPDGLTQVLTACGYTLGTIPVRAPAASAGQ